MNSEDGGEKDEEEVTERRPESIESSESVSVHKLRETNTGTSISLRRK